MLNFFSDPFFVISNNIIKLFGPTFFLLIKPNVKIGF